MAACLLLTYSTAHRPDCSQAAYLVRLGVYLDVSLATLGVVVASGSVIVTAIHTTPDEAEAARIA
jgi:hypothetical protein